MGWALTWYRVERQETRKAKSEGGWYLTTKSSTTRTKVMGREELRKRPGVSVWWKSKLWRRETRRRLDSLPASLRPYIVCLLDAEDYVRLSGFVLLEEG
jgi:hypothetical protein